MPRLISFAHTAEQFLRGTKTVTRRIGWRSLKPGTVLRAVRRIVRRKGQTPEDLGLIRVLSVWQERLNDISAPDVVREGFPRMTRGEFIAQFCLSMNCTPGVEVTRIEFERID